MPIKGLHRNGQTPGLARAGVIRLGYKARKCAGCGRITEPLEAGPLCPACGKNLPDSSFPRESPFFILSDAPGVAEAIGSTEPTELKVFFPFDEVDRVFPNYMQLWSASSLLCRGDGEVIVHAINAQTGRVTVRDGVVLEEFSENKRTYTPGEVMSCPGLSRDLYPKCAHCKPNAMMVVMLRDVPRLAYYQISTTSIHNIADITQQLDYVREQVARLTGEPRIAGVPFILRRVKRTVSVPNLDKNGNPKMVNGKPQPKQRTEKYFLELEIEPEWIAKMVRGIARLADPEQGRLALPGPMVDTGAPASHFSEPPTWEPRPDDEEPEVIEGEPVEAEPEPAPKSDPKILVEKFRTFCAALKANGLYVDPETGDPLPVTMHKAGPDSPRIAMEAIVRLVGNWERARAALTALTGQAEANNLSAIQMAGVFKLLFNGAKEIGWDTPVIATATADFNALAEMEAGQ